jgi:hypothetical protein
MPKVLNSAWMLAEMPAAGQIYVSPPGGETFGGRNVLALDETTHTFTVIDKLTPDESYAFAVAALNAADEGEAVITDAIQIAQSSGHQEVP